MAEAACRHGLRCDAGGCAVTDRVLGLDSGGTKTVAVVIDRSGKVTTQASGEGLDPTGPGDWEARLRQIVAPLGPVSAAVLGLPLHGEQAAISNRQRVLARALLGDRALVLNDVEVAFDGALGGQDGVLVLAGTGAMAWARGPLGVHRVGGWGPAFGDEGSAHWIGREALSVVSQQLDGRTPSTSFETALLAMMGLAATDLAGWADDAPRARIASVAKHVATLAAVRMAEAKDIMHRAADHLGRLGLTAARLSGATPWSYAGGVFADAGLRTAVVAQMGSAPMPPVLPPVGGALLRAATTAGWPTDATFVARLNQSLSELTSKYQIQPDEVSP